MRVDLSCWVEAVACPRPGGGRHRDAAGRLGEQLGERGGETCAVARRDEPTGFAVAETLGGAAHIVAHDRQSGALRLDEEIGERFGAGSEHSDGGAPVEIRGVGLPTGKRDTAREAERSGVAFAGSTGRAVADQHQSPRELCGECGDDVEQFALVLLRAKLGDAQQHGRLGGRGHEVEQGGVQQGVGDDGAAIRCALGRDEHAAGEVGVGDDLAGGAQGAAIQTGERFAGAHRRDDRGTRQRALELPGAAVGHAAHAKDDVGPEVAGGADEAGREPIEAGIEPLECAERDTAPGQIGGKHAARAEGDQRYAVAPRREAPGEEDRLSLGAAAAQPILHEENFHCSGRVGREIRAATTMNNGFFNLVLRWAFLAMGVALAAKIVPGISCVDGSTLFLVVVLLSLFNAFLKPLLVLFTLPLVVLSAGFGLWLINAFLLWGTSRFVSGFHVDGLWAALLGSLIISLTNMAFSTLFGAKRVRVQRGPRGPQEPPRPNPPPGKGDVIDV